MFCEVILVVWNQPWWEYLYHGHQQMLQMRDHPPSSKFWLRNVAIYQHVHVYKWSCVLLNEYFLEAHDAGLSSYWWYLKTLSVWSNQVGQSVGWPTGGFGSGCDLMITCDLMNGEIKPCVGLCSQWGVYLKILSLWPSSHSAVSFSPSLSDKYINLFKKSIRVKIIFF